MTTTAPLLDHNDATTDPGMLHLVLALAPDVALCGTPIQPDSLGPYNETYDCVVCHERKLELGFHKPA